MTSEKPWFVVQLIPYYINLRDGLAKVWLLSDKYREELEIIASESPNFFVHYADPKAKPPVYFKFSVKNPLNISEFKNWVDIHKNDRDVACIKLDSDQNHPAYDEAAEARKKIFDLASKYNKSTQVRELKTFLENNDEYQKLGEKEGRHFLRNMLKFTIQEEVYFNNSPA